MEEILKIVDSNNVIHGKLNSKKQSNKLIIFVHWLWGNIHENIFFNWYKFFNNKWFDTFRINLYREINLTKNSIANQSKDLEATINYFKNKYSHIYLVWHSLWWPIILLADTSFVKKIVLRNPCLNTKMWLKNELKYSKNYTYVSWWMDIIIWDKMKEEILSIWDINHKLDERVKIIYASDKELFTELTRTDIQYNFVENSDHCFRNEWNLEELLEKTFNYLQ